MMTRVLLVHSLSCCEHFSKCDNAKYCLPHIFSLNESLSFIPINPFYQPNKHPQSLYFLSSYQMSISIEIMVQ